MKSYLVAFSYISILGFVINGRMERAYPIPRSPLMSKEQPTLLKGGRSTQTSISEQLDKNNRKETVIIKGGIQRGRNLFHSFTNFNIKEGKHVTFKPQQNIRNIFTRVTGGSASNISGTLEIESSSKTNFFLINPNGIKFGGNAQIITNGSFLGSTASGIIFSDNYVFSTQDISKDVPLLTVSLPVGLSFINSYGNIDVETRTILGLRSPQNQQNNLFTERQKFALLGGKISINRGEVFNNSGQLDLGAISEGETIKINRKNLNFILDFKSVNNFEDIEILNNGRVSTASSLSGYGSINIFGKELSLHKNSRISSTNIKLPPNTEEIGVINIDVTDSINLSKNSEISSAQKNSIPLNNITIKTKELTLNESSVKSDVFSEIATASNAGTIEISAQEVFLKRNSKIRTNSSGTGQAGEISIETLKLELSEASQISSDGKKDGDAGSIVIKEILDNQNIPSDTSSMMILSGGSAITTTASRFGSNAGSIDIDINQISLLNSGMISSSANPASTGGNAGKITLYSRILSLDNQSSISASTTGKVVGDISIQDLELVKLSNNSKITTQVDTNQGKIDGGNISITAKYILGQDNGDILANASDGDGGNIDLDTKGLIGFVINQGSPSIDRNDINANSETGRQGVVLINNLDNNFKKISTLPTDVIDSSLLLAQSCSSHQSIKKKSQLYILPQQSFSRKSHFNTESQPQLHHWIKFYSKNNVDKLKSSIQKNARIATEVELVEADTWHMNESGLVSLRNHKLSLNIEQDKSNCLS